MKAYYVRYRSNVNGEEKGIQVLSNNKAEAYDKAVYEEIPKIESTLPYSAWVSSVTYNNGKCIYFNTSEGNPY